MQPLPEDQPTERIESAWQRLDPMEVRALAVSATLHVLFLLFVFSRSAPAPLAPDHRLQHLIQVADWVPPSVSAVVIDISPLPEPPPAPVETPDEAPAPPEEIVEVTPPPVREPAPPVRRERREPPPQTVAVVPDPPAPTAPTPPVEEPSPLPIVPADPATPTYEAVATSETGDVAAAATAVAAVTDAPGTAPGRGGPTSGTSNGRDQGTGTTAGHTEHTHDGLGEVRRAYQSSIEAQVRRAAAWTPAMRRRGLAGTIHLEIRVDAEGRIVDVLVHRSSGNPSLDDEALAQIRGLRRLPQPPSELGEEGRRLLVPLSYGV